MLISGDRTYVIGLYATFVTRPALLKRSGSPQTNNPEPTQSSGLRKLEVVAERAFPT
jgi:hypothetical protein